MMPRARDGRLKIAIVKLSSLGDVIHALPVARALKQAHPSAHLTWIVEAREYAILRDHPDLDAVVPVDTRLWRRLIWKRAGARQVWDKLGRLTTRIRAAHFDVALDLQGLIKSGLLTAYTGAPLRIGFSAGWSRERLNCLFTNRHVTPPPSAVHVVEQYLALLAPLGIAPSAPEFHVPSRPEAERRMEEFLGEHGVKRQDLLVALNPGAGRENKRWPVAHFRTLAERLGAEPGVRLLLLWGPDEVHIAVRATGVNFADLLMRAGLYGTAPRPPYILRSCTARGRKTASKSKSRCNGTMATRKMFSPSPITSTPLRAAPI